MYFFVSGMIIYAMLYGHANRVSRLYCLLLVIGLIKVGWFHTQNEVKDFRHSALDAITQAARRDEFSPSLGCATLTNNRRHLGLDKLTVPGRYFRNFWVGMCRWDPGYLNLYQS